MFPIVSIEAIVANTKDPCRLVCVEESPEFPGELLFQTLDDQSFLARYREWVSRFLCLNELFMLKAFVDLLEKDGWSVSFTPSTKGILENYVRWQRNLEIEGFTCPGAGQLYPYQTFSIHRALERTRRERTEDRLFFYGWCTGSGKSLGACAGAQELFNRGEIDVVLCFTLMKMKHNFAHAATASFAKTTKLDVVVNDGLKSQRTRGYVAKHQVYVLNYEKVWADYERIKELTAGKRVLFICDEAQRLLTAETDHRKKTKTRKHFDKLVAGCHAIVWPMSASVVSNNPLRYRDVFNLAGGNLNNPLGSVTDFTKQYTTSIKHWPISAYNEIVYYEWNLAKLHEVRHRVAGRTQSARKTDPGVREFFKGNTTFPVSIQMSKEDRKLYDIVCNDAYAARKNGDPLIGYYRLLRYICNTPATLTATSDPLGVALASQYPKLANNSHSSKLEFFLDQVESIAGQGDKVIAFTQWTNLSLLLLAPDVEKRGISQVLHYGMGQKDAESRAAQHIFKTDPSITLFFSSDAGAHGLNLPEAKYCINYECPYSYDLLMQRSERNNRADSEFDTTTYIYVTENTVEERIYEINEERRLLAAATLGTAETLSYGGRATKSEESNLNYLIWGED